MEFEWRPFPDYYKLPGRMDSGRAINPIDLPCNDIGELRQLIRPEPGIDRAGGAQPEETLIGGRALIGRLLLALEGAGYAVPQNNTSARSLIVDGERVVGVQAADSNGDPIRIKAKYGVLLSAGGIEGSSEMRTANKTPGRKPAGSDTSTGMPGACARRSPPSTSVSPP